MSDYEQYTEHFPTGSKVNIGIPVPGGTVFRDWAVILDIEEDLVELQLSRDMLPAGVRLSVGTILDVRGGKEDTGYSCRAIMVAEGYRRVVMLRLIGEIVSDELREFYRIDAFLPIKYTFDKTLSETKLKLAWQTKREARIEQERERKESIKKPWQRLQPPPQHEESPEENLAEELVGDDVGEGVGEELDTEDHSWDDVIPLAANISGGGIRILLHHQLQPDDLVMLEIYIPSEPTTHVVDAVGKVVACNLNYAATKQMHTENYNTAIEFMYIDERDRDAIVSFISNVQLKRIRMLRENYLGRGLEPKPQDLTDTERLRLRIVRILISMFVLSVLTWLFFYFKDYSENRPKNEIELIFEKGFLEYLKKSGRTPPSP